MKRMVIGLLIVVFGFSTGITIGQSVTLTKVGEWGTAPYLDVFVQGNYAYCATGKAGLEIIDITSLADPVKAGRCDTPGYAVDVYVSGNYAYIGDDEQGLQIIDVSNPAAPTPVGNYPTTGSAYDVVVSGNHAYVTDTGGKLLILDISNPASPTLTGSYNTYGAPSSVRLKGNYAYLQDLSDGLHIIDISVPTAPTQVGTYVVSPQVTHPFKMYVRGNYAYVTDYSGRLVIIDVSNPAVPTPAGTYDDGGNLWAVAVVTEGNYAYVSDYSGQLQVIDISNPSTPTKTGYLDTPGNPEGIYKTGNYVYTAVSEGGLAIIDVAAPSIPVRTGAYDDAGDLRRVHVNGNRAYAMDRMGSLKVLDVSVPSSPHRVGDYGAFETVSGVDTAGNYAYAVSSEGTFYIIDVSNPSSPSTVGTAAPGAGSLTDVAVSGNYAYLLSGSQGLRIMDISTPSSPVQVGQYTIQPVNAYASVRNVEVSGNYAYIAPESSLLYIIDISVPSAPTLAATYNTPNVVVAADVSGNYAYLALSSNGLYILDISTPSSPTLVGSYDTPGEAFDVFVSGNYAFVADYESGVHMIDISDPSAPTLAASYDTPGNTTGVYVSGNYAYAADGVSGKLIILAATDPSDTPQISLNREELFFGAEASGAVTGAQSILVENSGTGTLNWTASTDQNWLSCSPSSGGNTGEIWVSVDKTGLSPGTYTGAVTVSDSLAINSPRTVTVTLNVYRTNHSSPPFGVFSTPLDGSTVSSSIPVTGWVLDDIGVLGVQIFRQEGNSRVYIGDAILVEGARPDVEQAYPGYPENYKAGWGYMMLTNFLPGGDGNFTISAVVTDMEGNEVTLGTKRITVDNANAVKPFGAIDTPAQGAVVSGSNYRNHGWVLTPIPNAIPVDGSTIEVFVDGVSLGHPVYNIYREDIAALFPGYANSDGAHAYFDFDTTVYGNGVHTIYWTAEDDAGNADGIGSRYFSIQNSTQAGRQKTMDGGQWTDEIPLEYVNPVGVRIGYRKDMKIREMYPDENGIVTVNIRELERVVIHLGPVVRPLSKRELPIGSTFDPGLGIFYWSPGPGFLGLYEFVFIENQTAKRIIHIRIAPK